MVKNVNKNDIHNIFDILYKKKYSISYNLLIFYFNESILRIN